MTDDAPRYGGDATSDVTPEIAEENFRIWFGRSQVLDDAGEPLVLYHATSSTFDRFEPQKKLDAGFHFGTREQAAMRARRDAVILEVYLSAARLKRVKDNGQWTKNQIKAAQRAGYDGIVYLNRYEGIPTERIDALFQTGDLCKLDQLSDRDFAHLVPEAQDSFIVFEANQVKAVDNPGTWSKHDPRIRDDGCLPTKPNNLRI